MSPKGDRSGLSRSGSQGVGMTVSRVETTRRRHRAWCEAVSQVLRDAPGGVVRVGRPAPVSAARARVSSREWGGRGTDGAEVLTRRAIEVAVEAGVAVRHGRGVIAAPGAAPELVAGMELCGVVSHLSAALLHGWEVASPPEHVHLTVPRGRRVARFGRPRQPRVAGRRVTVHYSPVAEGERSAGITEPARTVLDCAVLLPFGEALAVADSALRAGDVTQRALIEAADALRGPGRARARRVARNASDLAANPFESMLRAICLEIPGLEMEPQVAIETARQAARVDLCDRHLRLVVEGDSYGFHSSPTAFEKDVRRYDELVAHGWMVLRFSWHQVFADTNWVRAVLTDVVILLRGRPRTADRRMAKAPIPGGSEPGDDCVRAIRCRGDRI